MNDKKFDNFFKQAFENTEVQPSNDLFEKIAPQIKLKRSKSKIVAVWSAVAAIVLLAIVLNMSSRDNTQQPKIVKLDEPINIQKKSPAVKPNILVAKNNLIEVNQPSRAKKTILLSKATSEYQNKKIAIKRAYKPIKIQEVKIAQEKIAPISTKLLVANKKTTLAIANAVKPLNIITDSIIKNNVAIAKKQSAYKEKKYHTLLSKLLESAKSDLASITGEIVEVNEDYTKVHIGFIAITKYKH